MYKRIIASFLAIATAVTLVAPIPAQAISPTELVHGINDFFGWVDSMYSLLTRLDDYADASGFYDSLDRDTAAYCSLADSETNGRNPYHYWGGALLPSNQSCQYCGLSYSAYKDLLKRGYGGFTSSLDYSTVASSGLFSIYPSSWHFELPDAVSQFMNTSALVNKHGGFEIGGTAISSVSGYYWVYSDPLPLPDGAYRLYFNYADGLHSSGSYGTYWHDMYLCGANDNTTRKLLEKLTIRTDFSGDWIEDNCISFSTLDYDYDYYFIAHELRFSSGPGGYFNASRYCHLDCLGLYEPVSVPDSSTRPTSIMDVISKWNKDNSIGTNPININYYISPTGQDVTSDTLSNPSLYDEETMVFTDPVTGNQYLTSGWTYDYLTRCYTLDMADTFTIGESVIDTIKLTYGDEKLTIDHYSNGSLIQSDSYDYVMASGSECGLNGHSYTYETIKQESCTSTGERKYTCSVCGDEYAETVPASEHPFTYTVAKPATCLSTGMGIYTCPDCGLQSTETIPKSGHSSVVVEVVPSQYDENGALISAGYTLYECTECGSQYTESEDVGVENESWFSWLGSLFKTLLSSIVNGLAAGLEWVIEEVLVTTVGWIIKAVEWVFGLFNGEHLTTLFNWFSFENEAWTNEFSDPTLFKEVA